MRDAGRLAGIALALIGAATLSACKSTPLRHGHYPCTYPGLGLTLAGPQARDCGVIREGEGPLAYRRMEQCAAEAESSRRPFRFGVGFIGIDNGMCHVVVRDPAGQLWSIEHEYDASLELEDPRHGPKLYVGRCASLEWSGRRDMRDFFTLGQCKADDAGYEAVERALRESDE